MITFKQFRVDEIWWISKKVLINNDLFDDSINKRIDRYKKPRPNRDFFSHHVNAFVEQAKKQENKDIFETKYKNDQI